MISFIYTRLKKCQVKKASLERYDSVVFLEAGDLASILT